MDRYVTLTEASVALGVTAATLRAQARKGRLLTQKRGRDLFVHEDEVDRYRTGVQQGGRRSRQTPHRGDQEAVVNAARRAAAVLPPGRREPLQRLIRSAADVLEVAGAVDDVSPTEAVALRRSRQLMADLRRLERGSRDRS